MYERTRSGKEVLLLFENYEYRASNLNEVLSEKMLKDARWPRGENLRGTSSRKQAFLSSLICLNSGVHVICATRLSYRQWGTINSEKIQRESPTSDCDGLLALTGKRLASPAENFDNPVITTTLLPARVEVRRIFVRRFSLIHESPIPVHVNINLQSISIPLRLARDGSFTEISPRAKCHVRNNDTLVVTLGLSIALKG